LNVILNIILGIEEEGEDKVAKKKYYEMSDKIHGLKEGTKL